MPLPVRELVIASGNRGKIREFGELFAGRDVAVHSLAEFTATQAAETGGTFVENAILKARHAASVSGLPALADDSGLIVDALQGAPGIHSARYAGEQASDQDNVNKLLGALSRVAQAQRRCRFVCVIACLRHPQDPLPLLAHGSWEGRVLDAPAGSGGFGYDPVFYDEALRCSAAQLPPAEKNRVSHRGRALAALMAAFAETGF